MAYTPRFVSQFDGSRLASVNCSMAAGAMLLDKQTRGKVQVTAADLRGRQSDQSGGTDLAAVAAAFKTYKASLSRVTLPTVLALRNALLAGRGAILQGPYRAMPAAYRLQANANIDHAIYIDRVRQTTGPAAGWWYWVMDPIGKGGYSGAWVPESAIRSFGWATFLGWVGSAALSSADTAGDPGPQLGAWGDPFTGANPVVTFPVGHILTTVDVDTIVAKLTQAGWFALWGPVNVGTAQTLVHGILSKHVGQPWNKALQDQLQAEFNQAAGLAGTTIGDPMAGIAQAIGSLVPGLADAARNSLLLAATLILVLLGVYMLARS